MMAGTAARATITSQSRASGGTTPRIPASGVTYAAISWSTIDNAIAASAYGFDSACLPVNARSLLAFPR